MVGMCVCVWMDEVAKCSKNLLFLCFFYLTRAGSWTMTEAEGIIMLLMVCGNCLPHRKTDPRRELSSFCIMLWVTNAVRAVSQIHRSLDSFNQHFSRGSLSFKQSPQCEAAAYAKERPRRAMFQWWEPNEGCR